MDWMLLPFRRYFDFSGRSRRKEFWMFALLNVIVYAVLMVLMFGLGSGTEAMLAADPDDPFAIYGAMFGGLGILILIWGLIVLIPSVAVSVRRLHDRDLSGWWYLAVIIGSLIPIVGFLVSIGFLVLMALPGTEGANRFGPDPKGGADPSVFE
ncbi:DUF805 domain-containing protein [Erythrobacter litoralis]|uniref:DUF805 domain-containing protein n=1 Tax=Erythrobacter litoralis (strain HTCC2594) TaxID=314225 RepID=Q2N8U7_ERYLH|nr:DUF805 domain-containing protein [Erythrobacter litoralis]ABC63894.1 hypothetical protein ELI_09010 [Erythrobacter litoralis HTCC2594]